MRVFTLLLGFLFAGPVLADPLDDKHPLFCTFAKAAQ